MAKLGLLARGAVGAIGGAAQAQIDIREREGAAIRERALADYKQKNRLDLEKVKATSNLMIEKLRQGGTASRAAAKEEGVSGRFEQKQAVDVAQLGVSQEELGLKKKESKAKQKERERDLADERARENPDSFNPLTESQKALGVEPTINKPSFKAIKDRELRKIRGEPEPEAPPSPPRPASGVNIDLSTMRVSARPASVQGPTQQGDPEVIKLIGTPAVRSNGDKLKEGLELNSNPPLIVRNGKLELLE